MFTIDIRRTPVGMTVSQGCLVSASCCCVVCLDKKYFNSALLLSAQVYKWAHFNPLHDLCSWWFCWESTCTSDFKWRTMKLPATLGSPKSDKNEISPHIISPYSNIQVMRIKKVITKDKMS